MRPWSEKVIATTYKQCIQFLKNRGDYFIEVISAAVMQCRIQTLR